MFSFDSKDGLVNLDPKKLLTTQDVDAAFSRDGCRVIVFFLYGRSNETNTYPNDFRDEFGALNNRTNQDIDFWTYYSSPNYDKLPDYQVEAGLKQLEISESAATRRRDNNNSKEKITDTKTCGCWHNYSMLILYAPLVSFCLIPSLILC